MPAASIASHSMAVEPMANRLPEARSQVATPGPSTASLVVGAVNVTCAPVGPVASVVTSSCGAMTGGVVSTTLTTKWVCAAWLPAASTASHLMVVEPSGNRPPEAGTHVATPAPSTASLVAGAVYVTCAPSGPVASAVTSSCGSMTGPVAATTDQA